MYTQYAHGTPVGSLGGLKMATITKRERAGGARWRAEIMIKRGGEIIHRESRTFDQRRLAAAWAQAREVELQTPGVLQRMKDRHTVGDVVRWYIDQMGGGFGRSKSSDLKYLLSFPVAALSAAELTARQLIEHVRARRADGTGAATVNNDLIWLRVAFKAARPALGLDLNLQAIDDAAVFCREHKLISKPAQRSRRPSGDELSLLLDYFRRRDKRADIPMVDIVLFAIHSARRQEEITRLRWEDNDASHHTGVVRDAKHPRAKEGNHREFKYTPEGWEIVSRQPTGSEFIFPFESKSISSAFTRACHALGIEDLRFHDLRHHATSLLFEKGYSIVEVQQFTLHESWSTLQRYTHLTPKKLQHR